MKAIFLSLLFIILSSELFAQYKSTEDSLADRQWEKSTSNQYFKGAAILTGVGIAGYIYFSQRDDFKVGDQTFWLSAGLMYAGMGMAIAGAAHHPTPFLSGEKKTALLINENGIGIKINLANR